MMSDVCVKCSAPAVAYWPVVDPFLGSGTTMKVARDLRRSCTGIELNPAYVAYTKKRLNWGAAVNEGINWEK